MKKILFLITVLFLLGFIPSFATPTDITTHWAKDPIEHLMSLGAINGYPDQTFKPDRTMTRAEFTKILLGALGENVTPYKTGHWAQAYIDMAIGLNLLTQDTFKALDTPITRLEIARMLAKTDVVLTPYEQAFVYHLSDLNTLAETDQEAILKVYGSGIITGYPNATYRPSLNATRAEAATLVVRLIDPSQRKTKALQFNSDTLKFYDGKNGRKALIALYGKVYDVTKLSPWKDGDHFYGVTAGMNLDELFYQSPHSASITDKALYVGTYVE